MVVGYLAKAAALETKNLKLIIAKNSDCEGSLKVKYRAKGHFSRSG